MTMSSFQRRAFLAGSASLLASPALALHAAFAALWAGVATLVLGGLGALAGASMLTGILAAMRRR